jgi:hypothetical protein
MGWIRLGWVGLQGRREDKVEHGLCRVRGQARERGKSMGFVPLHRFGEPLCCISASMHVAVLDSKIRYLSFFLTVGGFEFNLTTPPVFSLSPKPRFQGW